MKKLLALVMCLMMMLSCAQAEENLLPGAGAAACPDVLMGQAVVMINEDDGTWTARSYQTDAMLDWFFVAGDRNETPFAVTIELEGDMRTGVVTPLLKVYRFIGKSEASVTALSLLIGDTRYDFNVASARVAYGGETYEVLYAPLGVEALVLPSLLAGGEAVGMRLYGEDITTVLFKPNSTATVRRVEMAALSAAATVQPLLDAASMDSYGLWDLTFAAWEKKTGVKPLCVVTPVNGSIGDSAARDDFGMVMPGTDGKAADAAQQLLIDAGFLAGTPLKAYGDRAANAAKRAQAHYGLVQTGCVDGMLAGMLAEGNPAAHSAEATPLLPLGNVAGIALDRWWIASEARASRAAHTERTVSNSDNVLIVADGMLMNTSGEPIRFVVDMTAELVCDGLYAFDVIIVCEGNNGTTLETTMIPQAQSRVLAYAEVPEELARREGAQWTLTITAGDESVTYMLKH